MFRANDTQQITVYDSFLNQPAHIQRLIEKSWAKDFSDVIFPAIHEERFSVLYSSVGSRPNTPVNVLVGSMLLKEYFGQTEEELLMSIYCDVLYQYALHLTQEVPSGIRLTAYPNHRERVQRQSQAPYRPSGPSGPPIVPPPSRPLALCGSVRRPRQVRVAAEGAASLDWRASPGSGQTGQEGALNMISANIPNSIRKRVYARDGYRCALCDSTRYLQIHHYCPRSHGGNDSEENLITLCSDCHALVHGTILRDWQKGITPEDVEQACAEYLGDLYAPDWWPYK